MVLGKTDRETMVVIVCLGLVLEMIVGMNLEVGLVTYDSGEREGEVVVDRGKVQGVGTGLVVI